MKIKFQTETWVPAKGQKILSISPDFILPKSRLLKD